MTHLTRNLADVAQIRCPDCRAMVALSASGDGVLRICDHADADGAGACPASGKSLGKINNEGKDVNRESM